MRLHSPRWDLCNLPARRAVDDPVDPGQFILTGSAVPSDDITRHTGAGRIARLRMRPMSLFEVGRSTERISLRELLAGQVSQPLTLGSRWWTSRTSWPSEDGQDFAGGAS